MNVTSGRAFHSGCSVAHRPHALRRTAAAWFAAIVAAACAGSHRPDQQPVSNACVLAPPDTPRESITVVVSSALAGPEPRYQTLPGVDCHGRRFPQLARISSSEVVASDSARVRIRAMDASAARDALDASADLVVTEDAAIVAYASNRNEFEILRLPWERVYVVLTSERALPNVFATLRVMLAELVANAVRGESRTTQPPLWWESSDGCSATEGTRPIASTRPTTRVVYRRGDGVAQSLAERLVALAGSRAKRGEDSVLRALLPRLSRAGARATAVALSPSDFAQALRAGDDLAYVQPLPRFAVSPCDELAALLHAAPWLESANMSLSVVPLVDTRSSAIVRRGRVGISVQADGSLRLLDGAAGKDAKQ